MNISIQPLGDSGAKVEFYHEVTPELNRTIQLFCQKLSEFPISGVIEWVPAYDSVGIYYDFRKITYAEIVDEITKLHDRVVEVDSQPIRLVHIPVTYGAEYGPDLGRVSKHNNCSESDVIKLHQEKKYLVYMLGFLPGFPYLGGMVHEIATPRLDNPRDKIIAGSVGIADQQTGIYPLASPGGWNIIGRTPVLLFEKKKENAFLFRAGDYVKFDEVSNEEFLIIKEQVEEGTYEPQVEMLNGGE
ncbi:5-oxoprolinase subunit PxpB [Virgibacillus necropolis]|uniref:5-oxoprolinase subunit PxpB n=1 Tax=Virgibacillus necropolis TaxID=163877 RepID=UPI00384C9B47